MSRRRPAGGPRKIPDKLPEIEGLKYGEKLGEGHFSEVYEGTYKGEEVAIKVIERGSDHLISTEIGLLQELRGSPNIIQFYEMFKLENTVLIFELVKSLNPDDFFDYLTPETLKFVVKSLCTATQAAHMKGIVHRDIKLANIMVGKKFTDLKLIDWGCGTKCSDSMSPKAGSRTVRSPEMLLGYRGYRTAGDCWAVGVFIYEIMTGSYIPWKAKTSVDALFKMAKIFGGKNLLDIAGNYDIEIDEVLLELDKIRAQETLETHFSEDCADLADPLLIDLMKKLLELDPAKRYNMDQALSHPYFQK